MEKPGLRCMSWVSCTGLIADQPPAPDLGLDLADLALRLDIGLAYIGLDISGAVAQGQGASSGARCEAQEQFRR